MPTRERKPALAALAVLLILVGALGATVMVMRAGNKISVVQVVQPVAIGQPIPESAIREVMISDISGDSNVVFIRWGQRADLIANYRAKTNLVIDSVLTKSMLTDKDDQLPAGKSLVGLSLKQGQFPETLGTGDTVAAYRVGNDAAKSQTQGSGSSTGATGSTGTVNTLINDHLIVKKRSDQSSGLGNGDTLLTVLVDSADAGQLTLSSAANEVALVLVPDSKN